MKTNKLLGAILTLGLVTISAEAATVTLQMSSGLTNAVNFANSLGVAQAGLAWGVIVDTGGTGINYQNMLGTTLSTSTSGIHLSTSDDYLFLSTALSGTLPVNAAFGAESGATGQLGNIASMIIGVPATNPVATGQAFALVWFDAGITQTSTLTDGKKFGFVENAAFLIPAGGATTSYASVFSANPDAIRPASQLLGVPETSTALLGALGVLGLLRRRR